MSVTTLLLPLLLSIVLVDLSVCVCRKSYMTICDSFEDFQQYKDLKNMKELMIGSVEGKVKPASVHLMKTLKYGEYHKLSTLIILRAITQLERTYAFKCNYKTSPMKYLTLYGNELKTIDNYHFPVLPLKRLSLVNNKIESIKRGAFTIHEIEDFDISDNLLETIERYSLPSENATRIITIRNNKLTHLENGCFPSSLRSLNLDKNNLRYVLDEVFGNLVNLQELTLSHNKFNEIPKISNMKQLVIFDISFNSISTVEGGIFKDMDNLKFLDLSNNKIASDRILEDLHTPGKQKSLTISLAFNSLRTLDLTDIPLEEKSLVLYGNALDCKELTPLKKQLVGHESDCDVEFASTGIIPYCFDYVNEEYLLNTKWEEDVKKFQEIIRNTSKAAKCNLDPDRYGLLHPVNYGCVA